MRQLLRLRHIMGRDSNGHQAYIYKRVSTIYIFPGTAVQVAVYEGPAVLSQGIPQGICVIRLKLGYIQAPQFSTRDGNSDQCRHNCKIARHDTDVVTLSAILFTAAVSELLCGLRPSLGTTSSFFDDIIRL